MDKSGKQIFGEYANVYFQATKKCDTGKEARTKTPESSTSDRPVYLELSWKWNSIILQKHGEGGGGISEEHNNSNLPENQNKKIRISTLTLLQSKGDNHKNVGKGSLSAEILLARRPQGKDNYMLSN